MSRHPVLTIFTATRNRAEFLPGLCESIAAQIEPGDGVEWLIVDDDSSDDTAEVAGILIRRFPQWIRYVRAERGGKHRAMNLAALEARGGWIMVVDSDDQVAGGALSTLLQAVLPDVSRDPRIGMIKGIKRFPVGPVNSVRSFKVPTNPCLHEDWIGIQKKFDVAEVIRRDVLARHAFPEYESEYFMAESWLWHRVDQTHLTIFTDEVLMDCFYQPTGLSAYSRSNRIASPLGAMDVYQEIAQSGVPLLKQVRAMVNWWRFYFHCKPHNRPDYRPGRRAFLFFAAPGWLISALDRVRSE